MSESELSEWASEDDAPSSLRPSFKSKGDEVEWERKQRNREYRVAARREKRLRKADEKKQRKLNATILRRMTKNPDKYNKNVDRNRRRDIEMERRKIYKEAVSQAERLAAIHDPSGKMFNVGPVFVQEDGKVVSVEALERRAQAQAERAARLAQENDPAAQVSGAASSDAANGPRDGIDPSRRQLLQAASGNDAKPKRLSKNQQKKLALLEERAPPPKPVIPDRIQLPEGEENWLALWDLSEEELERRVIREKRRKAAERKALREKQKEGKVERRAARDERRRVYREKKLEWKAIKEEEKVQRSKLLRVEQEEAKRIEIEVNLAERRRAMEVSAELGFTLENVEGVKDIKPKALGMRGQEVNFDILEIGDRPSQLKIKEEDLGRETKGGVARDNRVDLGKVADESKTKVFTSDGATPAGLEGDFVSLEFGGGIMDEQQFESLNYNHKLRRKLHRAIEAAQIQKELLVRARAKEYCESNGIEVPPELAAEYKPVKLAGRRILEDGTLETEKQERVRKRLELAEYNKAAKVLRRQAKAEAIEAGLRVFAELTGKKPLVANEANEANEATNPPANERTKPTKVTSSTKTYNEKPKTQSSKKRQREVEDSGIQETKRTKESLASSSALLSIAQSNKNAKEAVPEEAKSKSKKRKMSLDLEDCADGPNQTEEIEASQEKKRPKKENGKQGPGKLDVQGVIPGPKLTPEEVSRKRPKKSKRDSINHSTKANGSVREEENVKNGQQWIPDALNGDPARKDKFLRLLGANKVNGNGAEKPSEKFKAKVETKAMVEQAQDELERQFKAGIHMKNHGQRRKGLGA